MLLKYTANKIPFFNNIPNLEDHLDSVIKLAELDAQTLKADFIRVTLSRALPGAASSCSHPSQPDTCHCQSQGDNTQMILSFGLIKSPGLFELQSLQQIIAALRF